MKIISLVQFIYLLIVRRTVLPLERLDDRSPHKTRKQRRFKTRLKIRPVARFVRLCTKSRLVPLPPICYLVQFLCSRYLGLYSLATSACTTTPLQPLSVSSRLKSARSSSLFAAPRTSTHAFRSSLEPFHSIHPSNRRSYYVYHRICQLLRACWLRSVQSKESHSACHMCAF